MRKEYLPRPSGIPGTNNPRRIYNVAPLEIDLGRSSNQFRCLQIPEPNLIFGGQGSCSDPKTGLALYGPYGSPSLPGNSKIRVGIVGTSDGIDHVTALLHEISEPIEQNENVDCVLHPSFPGMNSQAPFNVSLVTQIEWVRPFDKTKICSLKEQENRDSRMQRFQEMYANEVRAISKLEDSPHVVLCVLSESIKPFIEVNTASGATDCEPTDQNFPDTPDRATHRFNHRFRSGLKAACMGTLPTELIWHGMDSRMSASGSRATLAWNFSLAILKKAGVTSWKLANTAEASCFIGISFYHDLLNGSSPIQRSFAHVFTERGDGFVVTGERVETCSEGNRDEQNNLSAESAKNLLKRALAVFEKHAGFSPRKVTVHKATPYSGAERQGFESALSKVPNFGLMTISKGGIACVRPGRAPILRGTAIPFDEKTGLVATSGYVPFLRGSWGNDMSHPVEIAENWGSITFRQAAEDLMRLTKLDLNSSDFCSDLPITMSRCTGIGKVLTGLGQKEASTSDNYYV
ncbi:MAG TPA: hypothetical protein VK709_20015 [Candidatus Saccharimonadales bacterium]|jgi:hypothetical protein|nr:hypothetical protein [Candidatus Saccharimonadales bacterium]